MYGCQQAALLCRWVPCSQCWQRQAHLLLPGLVHPSIAHSTWTGSRPVPRETSANDPAQGDWNQSVADILAQSLTDDTKLDYQ